MRLFQCDVCETKVDPKNRAQFKITGVKVEDLCTECLLVLQMCMDLINSKGNTKSRTVFKSEILKTHAKMYPASHKKEGK